MDSLQGSAYVDAWLPTGVLANFPVVGDINQLVTRPRRTEPVPNFAPGKLFDFLQQLQQRDGVSHTTADVVNLASRSLQVGTDRLEGAHQVVHAEHVTYLPSIAVDQQR